MERKIAEAIIEVERTMNELGLTFKVRGDFVVCVELRGHKEYFTKPQGYKELTLPIRHRKEVAA